jgi:hypothetical protein
MAVEVKITGMNPSLTQPSGIGKLDNVVLTLAPHPDWQWSGAFATLWKQHFYMMKRNAEISGGGLVVTCVPDELGDGLLDELKKVVAQTNEAVKAQEAADQEALKQKASESEAYKASLEKTAKGLKFE